MIAFFVMESYFPELFLPDVVTDASPSDSEFRIANCIAQGNFGGVDFHFMEPNSPLVQLQQEQQLPQPQSSPSLLPPQHVSQHPPQNFIGCSASTSAPSHQTPPQPLSASARHPLTTTDFLWHKLTQAQIAQALDDSLSLCQNDVEPVSFGTSSSENWGDATFLTLFPGASDEEGRDGDASCLGGRRGEDSTASHEGLVVYDAFPDEEMVELGPWLAWHLPSTKDFCQVCQAETEDLSDHVHSHPLCEYCSRRFPSEVALRQHRTQEHPEMLPTHGSEGKTATKVILAAESLAVASVTQNPPTKFVRASLENKANSSSLSLTAPVPAMPQQPPNCRPTQTQLTPSALGLPSHDVPSTIDTLPHFTSSMSSSLVVPGVDARVLASLDQNVYPPSSVPYDFGASESNGDAAGASPKRTATIHHLSNPELSSTTTPQSKFLNHLTSEHDLTTAGIPPCLKATTNGYNDDEVIVGSNARFALFAHPFSAREIDMENRRGAAPTLTLAIVTDVAGKEKPAVTVPTDAGSSVKGSCEFPAQNGESVANPGRPTFPCPVCLVRFTEPDLVTHMTNHPVCEVCKLRFTSETHRRNHMSKHKRCEDCDEYYLEKPSAKSRKKLLTHVCKKGDESPHSSQRFSSVENPPKDLVAAPVTLGPVPSTASASSAGAKKRVSYVATTSTGKISSETSVHGPNFNLNNVPTSKPVNCLFCAESFSSSVEFQVHMNKNHKKCPKCTMVFQDSASITAHACNPVTCRICMMVVQLDDLAKHEKKHPMCFFCNKRFATEKLRQAHLSSHHVSCKVCKIYQKDETSLQQHYATCTLVPCPVCARLTPRENFEEHYRKHPRCEFCQRVLGSHKVLADHIADCHATCGQCRQNFASIEQKNKHAKTCRFEPCIVCDKIIDMDRMDKHLSGHPSCDLCQLMFTSTKMMKCHKREEHADEISGS